MTSTEEWLDLYRMAFELGMTALRRSRLHVELRKPGFVPGDDVFIMTPEEASFFLKRATENVKHD